MEAQMVDVRMKMLDESDFDTILSNDMEFTGDAKFVNPVMIKGKFSGNIQSSGDLYIGDDAVVKAALNAGGVSVRGKVTGDITSDTVVELHSSAAVTGDITVPAMAMESGAVFNGTSRMISAGDDDEQ